MNLDAILNEWDKDAPHDPTELGNGSLHIANLHAKWLRILSTERLRLRKLEAEGRELRLAKHEFYTQGPTQETRDLGWVPPGIGRVLNKDLTLYMDADTQMIEHNLRVNYQAEVVAAVELIFKSIQNRSWEIARFLEDQKLKMGL